MESESIVSSRTQSLSHESAAVPPKVADSLRDIAKAIPNATAAGALSSHTGKTVAHDRQDELDKVYNRIVAGEVAETDVAEVAQTLLELQRSAEQSSATIPRLGRVLPGDSRTLNTCLAAISQRAEQARAYLEILPLGRALKQVEDSLDNPPLVSDYSMQGMCTVLEQAGKIASAHTEANTTHIDRGLTAVIPVLKREVAVFKRELEDANRTHLEAQAELDKALQEEQPLKTLAPLYQKYREAYEYRGFLSAALVQAGANLEDALSKMPPAAKIPGDVALRKAVTSEAAALKATKVTAGSHGDTVSAFYSAALKADPSGGALEAEVRKLPGGLRKRAFGLEVAEQMNQRGAEAAKATSAGLIGKISAKSQQLDPSPPTVVTAHDLYKSLLSPEALSESADAAKEIVDEHVEALDVLAEGINATLEPCDYGHDAPVDPFVGDVCGLIDGIEELARFVNSSTFADLPRPVRERLSEKIAESLRVAGDVLETWQKHRLGAISAHIEQLERQSKIQMAKMDAGLSTDVATRLDTYQAYRELAGTIQVQLDRLRHASTDFEDALSDLPDALTERAGDKQASLGAAYAKLRQQMEGLQGGIDACGSTLAACVDPKEAVRREAFLTGVSADAMVDTIKSAIGERAGPISEPEYVELRGQIAVFLMVLEDMDTPESNNAAAELRRHLSEDDRDVTPSQLHRRTLDYQQQQSIDDFDEAWATLQWAERLAASNTGWSEGQRNLAFAGLFLLQHGLSAYKEVQRVRHEGYVAGNLEARAEAEQQRVLGGRTVEAAISRIMSPRERMGVSIVCKALKDNFGEFQRKAANGELDAWGERFPKPVIAALKEFLAPGKSAPSIPEIVQIRGQLMSAYHLPLGLERTTRGWEHTTPAPAAKSEPAPAAAAAETETIVLPPETDPSAGLTPLMAAVVRRDISAFEKLASTADLGAKDAAGNTVWHHMIRLGVDPMMLPVHSSVNEVDASGRTPLDLVIDTWTKGSFESARQLIYRGAKVNRASGPAGKTPLVRAMEADNFEAAEALIHYLGADVNQKTPAGELVIVAAAKRGDNRVVEALLKEGAKIPEEARDLVVGVVLSPERSMELHPETAILSAGAGVVPLAALVNLGGYTVKMIKTMASSYKAPAGWLDAPYKGQTPIYVAASRGDVRLVKFLLKKGADPRRVMEGTVEEPGKSALDIMRADPRLQKLAGTLEGSKTQRPQKTTPAPTRGTLPLEEPTSAPTDFRAELGQALEGLTDHPSEPEFRALFEGNLAVLDKVPTADLPYYTDRRGNSLLHWAVLLNNPKAIEYLLSRGMPADQVNHEGRSPAVVAAAEGHEEALKQLVKSGAGNTVGKGAMTAAMRAGKKAVVDFLQQTQGMSPPSGIKGVMAFPTVTDFSSLSLTDQESILLKTLANVHEFNQYAIVTGAEDTLKMQGGRAAYWAHTVLGLFDGFVKEHPGSFEEEQVAALRGVMVESVHDNRSAQQLADAVAQGKTVSIHSGYAFHLVEMTFWTDPKTKLHHLSIANKSGRSSQPIKVLTLERMPSARLIDRMRNKEKLSTSQFYDGVERAVYKELGLTSGSELGKLIEESFPYYEHQVSGNCAFIGQEVNQWVLFMAQYAAKHGIEQTRRDMPQLNSKFAEFIIHRDVAVVDEYLDWHEQHPYSESRIGINREIIDNILERVEGRGEDSNMQIKGKEGRAPAFKPIRTRYRKMLTKEREERRAVQSRYQPARVA